MSQLRSLLFTVILGLVLSYPHFSFAQEVGEKLNLRQTIEAAIKANLRLEQSQDEIAAAQATKRARVT